MSDKYNIDAIRKRLKSSMQGRQSDPQQFEPARAKDGETHKYRFFILPPFNKNDVVSGGKASKTMDQFFVQQGVHWVDRRPYPCPRVTDGSDCPMCSTGFELFEQTKVKEERRTIAKQWLANVKNLVNIHFPDVQANPEELRGKTMYYAAPKTVFDIWERTLMSDNMGDEADPQACGCFFDESAAFLFQLECKKVPGQDYNEYKTSKFITQVKDGKLATIPIAKTQEGIDRILASRIDLFAKLETPDVAKLKSLVSKFLHGDDNGFDSDESKTTHVESAPITSKHVHEVATPKETVSPLDEKPSSGGPGIKAGSKAKTSRIAEESETEATEKASSSSADDELEAMMAELEE